MDVSVRLATDSDLTSCAELRWQWHAANEFNKSSLAVGADEFKRSFLTWARANTDTFRCVVAARGGAILGMAWLAVVPRVPGPASPSRVCGDIQSVYVVPEERDTGVGGRLLDALLGLSRELRLEHVTVHANERSRALYERRGFECSRLLLFWDGSTTPA